MNRNRIVSIVGFGVLMVSAMLIVLAMGSIAISQTPATVTSQPQTVITLNEILVPWIPVIVTFVSGVFTVLGLIVTMYIKRWTGVEIDKAHMQTLQQALENAAGKAVMRLGEHLKDYKFDVKSEVIKEGVDYVNKSAADSVSQFGLNPEDIAEKIIAKIGVVTASDSSVRPLDVSKQAQEN